MKALLAILAVLFVTPALAAKAPAFTTKQCKALEVIDGDTIRCNKNKVRSANYDTPEKGVGQYGNHCADPAQEAALVQKANVATARLAELIQGGRFSLRYKKGKDRYSRGLAWFYVNGKDVSATLIAEGLAVPYAGGAKTWCAAQ